jgi:hypothetical protein
VILHGVGVELKELGQGVASLSVSHNFVEICALEIKTVGLDRRKRGIVHPRGAAYLPHEPRHHSQSGQQPQQPPHFSF